MDDPEDRADVLEAVASPDEDGFEAGHTGPDQRNRDILVRQQHDLEIGARLPRGGRQGVEGVSIAHVEHQDVRTLRGHGGDGGVVVRGRTHDGDEAAGLE
ncbi:hypothetical protein PTW37_15605 [Arthrobacter agilis]|uniref:hypothetical protein n=1 Tax=Arthrobacter agilis TaxID=37921 RepID=UPI0023673CC7|nr:hypothetical protein [Arthrobacter agilis]WDF33253.1 hypothetical protein PTW37_15605 [Arthrobacter agilis]